MNKKMKRNLIILAILAALVLVACGTGIYFGNNGLFVKEIEKEFVIPQGVGAGTVVKMLKEEGLIKSEIAMKLAIKYTSIGGEIQSGHTKISSKMSYFEIIDKLVTANSTVKITIPEGFEIDDIVELLSREMGIPTEELFYELENGEFDYDFITDQLPAGRYRLEGYIFPETYFFPDNWDAHKVINECLAQFDKVYTDELKKQTEKMGFTVHEMVTLASIIEKEGVYDLDKISSVFHNRLKSPLFSKLESCATVIYVTKQPRDRLTYEDIQVDSPYNTYRYDGLPPGPIASPGELAIKAAIYPADTDYFFFIATDDGKNSFSKTIEEHNIKKSATQE